MDGAVGEPMGFIAQTAAIPKLRSTRPNRPVADFHCKRCSEEYELKSQKSKFGAKVVDGAFGTMCERLAETNNPNLLLLNYDLKQFGVTNLFVVPKHFFVREIIEKRKPLATTARRAGWTGCNILLNQIPESGKIFFVREGQLQDKGKVLDQWRNTLFLRDESPDARGWLIEVMKCVELVGKREFDLNSVYAFEERLEPYLSAESACETKNTPAASGATRPWISRFRFAWILSLAIPGSLESSFSCRIDTSARRFRWRGFETTTNALNAAANGPTSGRQPATMTARIAALDTCLHTRAPTLFG